MDDISNTDQAIELLQGLGLKEYEAKAFVALTRLPEATAKEIQERLPDPPSYSAVRAERPVRLHRPPENRPTCTGWPRLTRRPRGEPRMRWQSGEPE
jgi:hypothetical protein